MYFLTILVKLLCTVAARIFDAVQMNFYTFFVQGFYLVKYVDHTPVIGRIWYIKGDDM